ncbi:uncharacterized protein METZ01_LOCUS55188 [marine metagenome]|uniref:Uncharacterized protein n=1 Tax=marine metagenome TaxID=408172 RepID=A0A381SFT3_9ZZZZ
MSGFVIGWADSVTNAVHKKAQYCIFNQDPNMLKR